MPARTGREYLKGLQNQDREVWLGGERVKDVTTHPGLAHGAQAIAALYDMQHDPALREAMTYVSPTSGDRVGLSFIIPRTRQELEAAARDDAALGAGHLRHDGPVARLHERHLRRLGGGGGVLRAEPARVRGEHPALPRARFASTT